MQMPKKCLDGYKVLSNYSTAAGNKILLIHSTYFNNEQKITHSYGFKELKEPPNPIQYCNVSNKVTRY